MNKKIDKSILEILPTINLPGLVGYAVTGSQLLVSNDNTSDIDIVLTTLNRPQNYLSNVFNVYLKDTMIEILVEDIYDKIIFEDFLGYTSWINYLIPKRRPVLLTKELQEKYTRYQELLAAFRPFWIHCMLKGYYLEVARLKKYLADKDLTTATAIEKRNLYQICYTFFEDYPQQIKPELLSKIKHEKKLRLAESDIEQLEKILEIQEKAYYILDQKLETQLFNRFKRERDLIWK